MNENFQRHNAEILCAEELAELSQSFKDYAKPENWYCSPQAVLMFIMGGTLANSFKISPKYFGDKALVEIMISTLMSDRALLLIGVPGTAKTWIAEHICAAVSNNSSLLIQGTSGTGEESLRYSWNYAMLLSQGPKPQALVKSPIMRAMELGSICRIEELSRIPSETQDALISILSEKTMSIPELNSSIFSKNGFNVVATANHLDRGVFEMSSALRRRFNIVMMPLPKTLEEEVKIVKYRVGQLEQNHKVAFRDLKLGQVDKLVTMFRELRSGMTLDKKQKFKSSNATLSPAEAISIVHQAKIQSEIFGGDSHSLNQHFAQGLIQSIGQHSQDEMLLLKEYIENIIKKRGDWKDWYEAFKSVLNE